jgi:transposase InsO family protein
MPKVAMNGEGHFVTMLHDHSKFATVRVRKSKADVLAYVTSTKTLLQTQSGCVVQRIRTDRGSEFLSLRLSFCLAHGITHETTAGYTPQSNVAAERLNRMLLDRGCDVVSGLPDNLWADAVMAAAYIRNRAPIAGLSNTPHERFFGHKPCVAHLRVFGSRVYVHVPSENAQNLATAHALDCL